MAWQSWRPLRIEADVYCGLDLRLPPVDWPMPDGITIRVANACETIEAAAMRLRDSGERVEVEYTARLSRGQLCFVALRDGAVVGSNWLMFGEGYEGPVRIVLRPDEVLMMDAFTARPERGRAIHTALQHAMIVWAHEHGFATAHTFLIHHHAPAGKTIERMHWNQDERPRYYIVSSPLLRRLGLRHQLVIDAAPGRHPIPRGPWFRVPPFEPEPWAR